MSQCEFCYEESPNHSKDCMLMHDNDRRIDQLAENARFLREKIDAIHKILCPGLKGTWQDRAEQVVTQARRVMETSEVLRRDLAYPPPDVQEAVLKKYNFLPLPQDPPKSLRRHLDNLIGVYWDLAYAEGKEGRDHDTEDGDAQRTLFEINTCLDMIFAEAPNPVADSDKAECKTSARGLRLFQEQAVFLSKIGRELYIKCESVEDAEELYDFLESLATTPLTLSPPNRDFSETVVMRAASDFVEAVQERLSGNQLGFLDLSRFPDDWDFRLMVCCRGETLNGPPGIRRWQIDAVHRLPTHEEIIAGDLPTTGRVHVECMDTPQEAIDEVIRQINAGEYDFSRFGEWPETPGGPEHI